jgi:hypothetical protein
MMHFIHKWRKRTRFFTADPPCKQFRLAPVRPLLLILVPVATRRRDSITCCSCCFITSSSRRCRCRRPTATRNPDLHVRKLPRLPLEPQRAHRPSPAQNGFLINLSLRLSRACLGKSSVLSCEMAHKKRIFPHIPRGYLPPQLRGEVAPPPHGAKGLHENASSLFLKKLLSLCLSRACLGKTMALLVQNDIARDRCFSDLVPLQLKRQRPGESVLGEVRQQPLCINGSDLYATIQ